MDFECIMQLFNEGVLNCHATGNEKVGRRRGHTYGAGPQNAETRRLGSQHLNLPRSWYKISNQIEIARGVLKRTHCLRCKGCIVSYTGASRECNRGYTYTTHIWDAQAVSVRQHDTHTDTG